MTELADVAVRYAQVAVDNIRTEFPHATQQVVRGPGEPSRPRDLHPSFHGAYDWHSCVHMHWLLVRLLGEVPEGPGAGAIRETLDRTLTVDAVEAEAAYLRANPSFERPYGWAWAYALGAACAGSADPAAGAWSAALLPLVDAVEELTLTWLDRAVAPVRHGVHDNTAFALAILHENATAPAHDHLRTTIERRARTWFADDRDYPAAWEPSGQDFLSPALCEADLMRRVLPPSEFPAWLESFLPDVTGPFTPVEVRDATDGRQAHLYGLNLSRAWQFRLLANALPESADSLREAADRHLDASLPYVTGNGFASDHWLATYAYLALTA